MAGTQATRLDVFVEPKVNTKRKNQQELESVLYYFRARNYSAQLGRFISRDPLGFVDGMSLYRAYFVPGGFDPFGLQDSVTPIGLVEPTSAIVVGGGAAVGGGACAGAAATGAPVVVVAVAAPAAGYAGYRAGRCWYEYSPQKWCLTKVCDWWYPPHLPPPKPVPVPPKNKCEDEPCDCWCDGYQNGESIGPTHIRQMNKEKCLALSFKKSVPDTAETYEEICACGEGWWE